MAEGIGAADADILARRPDIDVVEAGVVDRPPIPHEHPLDELVFRDIALAGELLEGADRSTGELGARVAVEALSLVDEQRHPQPLAGVEGGVVPFHETVEGGLVGDERPLVHHHGQAPEKREVCLGLRVGDAVNEHGRTGGCPPLGGEGLLDEILILDLQALLEQRRRRKRIRTENAVGSRDILEYQRRRAEELPAEGAEISALGRHLADAQSGSHRLRSQARVVDGDTDLGKLAAGKLHHAGIRIAIAEWRHAVEDEVRPAVPKVAMIEDRIDRRGSISRLTAAHIEILSADRRRKSERIGRGGIEDLRNGDSLRGRRVGNDPLEGVRRRNLASGDHLPDRGHVHRR